MKNGKSESAKDENGLEKKIRQTFSRTKNAQTLALNSEGIKAMGGSKANCDPKKTVIGKTRNRFKSYPIKMGNNFAKSYQAPPFKELNTPDWFKSEQQEDIEVSVIVPCYKSKDYVRKQIEGWQIDDGIKKEIIYVDDCCPQKSHIEIVRSWEARKVSPKEGVGKIILVNGRNGGFSNACNLGAKFSKGKYLIFLNADTRVSDGWIAPMLECFRQIENVGIAGNLHLRGTDTIDSCGSEWDWGSLSFLHIGKHIYQGKKIERAFRLQNAPKEMLVRKEVEMVTGACFMIERETFDEVGGFDTAYEIGYWEDADLCMKIRASGKKIVFTPDSVIFHAGGHSNSVTNFTKNKSIFHSKWVKSDMLQGCVGKKPKDGVEVNSDAGKIAVYTAISNVTNNYDSLKEQKKHGDAIEYVAFLEEMESSKTWEFRKMHEEFQDPNRNAKIHKILSHRFFPEKEYTLWVDGSVKMVFPFSVKRLVDIYLQDCDMAVFKHSERSCIYEEANVCIQRKLDDENTIRKQIRRYASEGYPSNIGLAECTVILRRHSPKVVEFNEAWWDEIKNGSKRDQLSFNYVARKTMMEIRFFPGNIRQNNYLFQRLSHNKKKNT